MGDENDDALYDQWGDFRDQEQFEQFVEGYRPQRTYHPDEIDDDRHTINVDAEEIGDELLGERQVRFTEDFEATASAIYHFGRVPDPPPIEPTIATEVRAAPTDYLERSGINEYTGHPASCSCPECLLWQHVTDEAWERTNGQQKGERLASSPPSPAEQQSLDPSTRDVEEDIRPSPPVKSRRQGLLARIFSSVFGRDKSA